MALVSYTSHSDTSIAEGFALMLETACRDFEVFQRLIRQETKLIQSNGTVDLSASASVNMALAKSFVFYVVRARRICEHCADSLHVDRAGRKSFLKATSGILSVRDVNEHGFDKPKLGKNSKPSMHTHNDSSAILDETSMVILNDQRILMGPLNLYDIYIPTNDMKMIAGFACLPHNLPDSVSV